MKKILFVAISATLLAAGCQKTEILNSVGGPTLGFSTGMSKLTKAADADKSGIENLQQQSFRVWAYSVADDPNTTADDKDQIYDHIENLAVTYSGNEWGTDKEYFWPGVGKELSFFAVSADATTDYLGESGTTSSNVTVTPGTAPTIQIKDFVVKPTANEDLMVADFVTQHQSDKVVDLNFRHTLSKVEFIFLTTDAAKEHNVFVQSLKVEDLATKGTLTISPETATTKADATEDGGTGADGNDPTTEPEVQPEDPSTPTYAGTVTRVAFSWAVEYENATPAEETQEGEEQTPSTTPSTLVDFTDDWETPFADTDDIKFPASIDDVASTDEDKKAMHLTTTPQRFTTWLMMPQDISTKKVSITYVINSRRFTSVFNLYTASLKSWACNQHIKYKITLAPNLISFNPSVEDWQTPSTDVEYTN